jgi:DNA gyrase/topoisomerase IV subunit A
LDLDRLFCSLACWDIYLKEREVQETKTVKQKIVDLIYEQAAQVYTQRLTATTNYERNSLDGEREGLRQLLKTIEHEIPDE